MTGVGVGVIGAGNVLWAYLQVLDRLIPRGVAWEGPICARRVDAWSEIKAKRPGAQLVEDAERVLSSDVSVVAITTSPDAHAELVRRALEAGKHVVCEKPVAMSRAEAEPLFALASDRGLHLLAAPFVQLSPSFRDLWTRVAGRRDRRRPFDPRPLREPGLDLGRVVPHGRRGAARRGRDLQPEEHDCAGGAGRGGVRGGGDRARLP